MLIYQSEFSACTKMTCMAMRDKFAPRLVAIVVNYHALLFEPLDICRLQLYENRV